MVNTMRSSGKLAAIRLVVRVYVLGAVRTLGLLAVLSAAAPRQAPREAWVHAIIVAVFAGLMAVVLGLVIRERV